MSEKIVLTIGTFDLIHTGHIELLAESARLGQLFVGVNTDAFVERYKGRRPLQSLKDRLIIVSMIKGVQAALINMGDEDSKPLIRMIQPDLITIGDDWLDPNYDERRYHKQLGVTPEWLKNNRIEIVYLPRTRGRSSTMIRGKSNDRRITDSD